MKLKDMEWQLLETALLAKKSILLNILEINVIQLFFKVTIRMVILF